SGWWRDRCRAERSGHVVAFIRGPGRRSHGRAKGRWERSLETADGLGAHVSTAGHAETEVGAGRARGVDGEVRRHVSVDADAAARPEPVRHHGLSRAGRPW